MATNTTLNTGTVPIPVASGGTGDASLTAYAVLCGGTTSTGALQPIAGVGTSGQVLTSNGAGALPTFQAAGGGGGGGLQSVQVFTANGTWTRPGGVTKVIIELLGAGGGGGGPDSGGPNYISAGGGGGGYGKRFLDVSAISSATVTIGSGGAAGAADTSGSAGGTTSFGTYISCTGGSGGLKRTAASDNVGTNGGIVTSGTVNGYGNFGGGTETASAQRGAGANSIYGQGGSGSAGSSAATAALGYGAGGGGGVQLGSQYAASAGTQGIILVWEYA